MENDISANFKGKDCYIRCLDREEMEISGKILSLGDLGVVATYKANGRTFQTFVPMQNLSYIERKVLDDND